MSKSKNPQLIPFAIMGIIAFLCFTAIVVMQVLEYMHYDEEPSLWNKPGYRSQAVSRPDPGPDAVTPEPRQRSSRRGEEPAPEEETETEKTETDDKEENPDASSE